MVCLGLVLVDLRLIHFEAYMFCKWWELKKVAWNILTYISSVPHICVVELGHYWFEQWLAAYLVARHYLNQYRHTARNRLRWKNYRNWSSFIDKIAVSFRKKSTVVKYVEWRICVSKARLSSAHIMVCGLIGAKPLSEPMLDYFQLDPREQI